MKRLQISLGKAGRKIQLYMFSAVCQSPSRVSGSVNWLSLETDRSVFYDPDQIFAHLTRELFCLYGSRKYLVGFLSIALPEMQRWNSQRHSWAQVRLSRLLLLLCLPLWSPHPSGLGWLNATIWPCWPGIQSVSWHLGFPSQWLGPYRKERSQSSSRILGLPSRTNFSQLWYKCAFQTLQCGSIGLQCQIHSVIPISPCLWIPSFTVSQGRAGISKSLTVGHFLVHFQSTNQT